jgi:hypothetical protein
MGEATNTRRALKIGDSMRNNGGIDGTRTRGLLRDRQAFQGATRNDQIVLQAGRLVFPSGSRSS